MPFSYPVDCKGLYSDQLSLLTKRTYVIGDAVRDTSLSCTQWNKVRIAILPRQMLSDFEKRGMSSIFWDPSFVKHCNSLFTILETDPASNTGGSTSLGSVGEVS